MASVIDAILSRASEPRLTGPAPDSGVLEQVFACAARAPDHALLRPWRYLVVEGEGLDALGEVFASAATDPEAPVAASAGKLRDMPRRAPMIIIGIATERPHPKVPAFEQRYSCAAGMAYALLALEAAGFGAIWRTGEVAYHPRVHQGLGLARNESVVGFLYTGTVSSPKPAIPRPAVVDFVRRWPD